ncbi:endonuclease v-like [Plakobranchus ocellatus]|uniref:Endonuclease v-like n=1 Tax=Plakobranchus ocellatus TaxID=259542 RepID=A0AAV3ZUX1_9GAST|nr:endonuclease v-like [Plakobranchus ocellatus]
MKTCPFSLNIDEATSSSNKKVLAVLVSYYSPVKQQVVIEHLASVELVKTDASTIFNAIKDLMDSNSIPWKNLQSCLLDSCNVMRGAKTGVEAWLREQAPHLLDINSDSCHHIHNAVKQFCQPFEGWVERLFHDLNTDFKWSSISKDILAEICHLFNVKFSAPQRFIPHRWLSVYDTSLSTHRLLDMLRLFYYPFTASQTHKKKEINNIIHRFHKPDSKASVKVHHIFQRLRNMFKSLNKDN